MKLKRFIVCGWQDYYPVGGLGNIQATADTIEEARTLADAMQDYPVPSYKEGTFQRVEVYDRDGEDVHLPVYDPSEKNKTSAPSEPIEKSKARLQASLKACLATIVDEKAHETK